jgi:predicted protein tyrosine phosphatase
MGLNAIFTASPSRETAFPLSMRTSTRQDWTLFTVIWTVYLSHMKRKYEGNFKRVLCVCSAGILRSATIAWVLSNEPYRCNTRAVGLDNYALIRVTPQLLQWADEIVCADKEQFDAISRMTNKPVHCLHIPDEHDFRSPQLVSAIEAALKLLPIRGAIHEKLSHP